MKQPRTRYQRVRGLTASDLRKRPNMAEVNSIAVTLPPAKRFINLTGKTIGNWEVLGFAGKDSWGGCLWECRCACGAVKRVLGNSLRGNGSKKCSGCARTSHGHARKGQCTATYKSWVSLVKRCTSPNDSSFSRYGGRGIKITSTWRKSFAAFLADMGERPSKNHSIDRIDNEGHYEPGNCRWATKTEQGRNKRTNRLIAFRGEVKCLAEWAEQFGISRARVGQRLKAGWPTGKALTTPVRKVNHPAFAIEI